MKTFFSTKKTSAASSALNNIQDQRKLIQRGLKWILENDWKLTFGMIFVKWLSTHLETNTKQLSDFIDEEKIWKQESFRNCLLEEIINEINNTPIPVNNTVAKVSWKFTSTNLFSVKSVTWAENINIKPHWKAKSLNSLGKLNRRHKLQLFEWKLVCNMLPTRGKLRRLGMDINRDCPFCHKLEENIDHSFITCD